MIIDLKRFLSHRVSKEMEDMSLDQMTLRNELDQKNLKDT